MKIAYKKKRNAKNSELMKKRWALLKTATNGVEAEKKPPFCQWCGSHLTGKEPK